MLSKTAEKKLVKELKQTKENLLKELRDTNKAINELNRINENSSR